MSEYGAYPAGEGESSMKPARLTWFDWSVIALGVVAFVDCVRIVLWGN